MSGQAFTDAATRRTGSVPNLGQWFHLCLYATYFRTEFFDADLPDSLIYVYGLFALTFVVRPLGSWLFGRLADTRGRQRALVAAVTMMSARSVVLAVARLTVRSGRGRP
jgi:MHS family alpha-ketoglutarate permease-like MFS transporter